VNEIMADKAAKIEIMNCIVTKFACKSTELNNNQKLSVERRAKKEQKEQGLHRTGNHPK
jgi:hypothetical protein